MAKSSTVTTVEDKLREALEEFCFSNGAKPGDFSIGVFRHYVTGALKGEIVTDFFNGTGRAECREAAKDFLRRRLPPNEYSEIRDIHITERGAYSTWEERNEEGLRRMQYSRV